MDQAVTQIRSTRRRRLLRGISTLLKKRILAGLVTVIPIWVTYVIVRWIFDLMVGATEPLAHHVAMALQEPGTKLLPEAVQTYVSWTVPLLALTLTLFILYMLGLLMANVFGRRVFRILENVFIKLPLVKTIYSAVKQIVVTLGGGRPVNSHRIVLVEFPHPGMRCMGILTSIMEDADTGRKLATVFIPTTPNPTTGYLQIVPLDRLSETSWSMEEAVKLVMSGGIVSPPKVHFDKIQEVRVPARDHLSKTGTGSSI